MSKERLATQILPNSVAMLGVSLTAVGLVKVAEAHIGPSNVDEYCAVLSVFFLVGAILAYTGLRFEPEHPVARVLERIADVCFVTGLVVLTFIVMLFAYELI